jgi:hypothetical protein
MRFDLRSGRAQRWLFAIAAFGMLAAFSTEAGAPDSNTGTLQLTSPHCSAPIQARDFQDQGVGATHFGEWRCVSGNGCIFQQYQ